MLTKSRVPDSHHMHIHHFQRRWSSSCCRDAPANPLSSERRRCARFLGINGHSLDRVFMCPFAPAQLQAETLGGLIVMRSRIRNEATISLSNGRAVGRCE